MNKIKYLVTISLVFALTGCDSFLDLSPISQANENAFYKTEDDIETAMWSAYATLHTIYAPEGLPSYYGELMSDNAYSDNTSGDQQAKEAFETHIGMQTNNSIVASEWNRYYNSLFIINNILKKMESSDDFTSKTAIQGECRFLRALYYFDMVRMWGDVPLVLQPLTTAEAFALGRTSKDQVYQAIIEDLKFASDNLPAKASERFAGAATSDAANTLLGKVYLTMGDKANAKTYLMKEYNKFKLMSNYADLWSLSKKNCAESIFEIQYLAGTSNPYSKYWALFTPLDNRIVTAWGMGCNQVEDELWNAYETGDPRRDPSIQDGYKTASGSFVEKKFTIKWRDTSASLDGLTEAAGNNFIVLRYADVLLMLTEATGDVSYLNEVRARAGLPAYGQSGYPAAYNTVAKALDHEYRVEFACEFHRYFDMVRLGITDELKTCAKHVGTPIILLPIPQEVIDQNPNVMKQNSGY